MPRIRYLKPEFFLDEDLAELPIQVRLFFAGLWCHADKAGRLQDRPKMLKAVIFPYDNVSAEKCLSQLSQPKADNGQPFVYRYEVDGRRYIQIASWDRHQKPHHTEQDSKIPPHPPMGKGMGMEKQLEASSRLDNGGGTVTGEETALTAEKEAFDSARRLYPGTKRGLETEWKNFTKKHKDYRKLCSDLVFAVQIQIAERKSMQNRGEFVPPWKHFQTWINNRWWETAENAKV